MAHTHEMPGFEGELEPPLLLAPPPQKSGRGQLRIGDPLARQGLLFKPANTTGDIPRFSLLFKGDQGIYPTAMYVCMYVCMYGTTAQTTGVSTCRVRGDLP